ncbi:MAG: hypothetical protein LBP91_05610 [Coriobacteriales bacterium]|jgi:Flp pilus assembly protein TadG|nr:hypothetical protein [Coriobacteriales bacterium]
MKRCEGQPAKRCMGQAAKRCEGQASVEYLIVGLALMVVIAGLGALSVRLEEGLFVQHAADSASHAITTNTAGSLGDILLY